MFAVASTGDGPVQEIHLHIRNVLMRPPDSLIESEATVLWWDLVRSDVSDGTTTEVPSSADGGPDLTGETTVTDSFTSGGGLTAETGDLGTSCTVAYCDAPGSVVFEEAVQVASPWQAPPTWRALVVVDRAVEGTERRALNDYLVARSRNP